MKDAWWEVLDVEQNADLREIKRAYAKKLKSIRQDENPDAFMALRESYEYAKAFIQHRDQEPPSDSANMPSQDIAPIALYDTEEISELTEETDKVEGLIERVKLLLSNNEKRGILDEWQKIFDDLETLDVNQYMEFENFLLYVLGDYSHRITKEKTRRTRRGYSIRPKIMPVETANQIFNQFSWNSQQHRNYFSDDMQRLRTLLGAHTKDSQAVLSQAALEKHAKSGQDQEAIQPINIVFMILGGIALLRLILSFFGLDV